MNRLTPVRVWGPSGAEPKYGTKYALEKLKEAYTWDLATRSGALDARGLELQVNEFDYKGVNAVIYETNGVVIRSLPAIHGIDGAVSFILEWNGLKFAYSSDTFPNKWWLEYTKGADIAIHECFLLPSLLVTKQGFTPMEALVVGSLGHTSPEQFGKVMSETKPRLAVGYHFFNDFDTAPAMMAAVRKTYDGPRCAGAGLHGLQRHQERHPGAHVRDRRGGLATAGATTEGARARQDAWILGVHQLRSRECTRWSSATFGAKSISSSVPTTSRWKLRKS